MQGNLANHQYRHPEIVSGSIPPRGKTGLAARWILKRVQDHGSFIQIAWGKNLDPAGRVRPFRFFEKGGLADGSEGEDRPDHQRLSRKGQHSADHGFEIAH
ncbi:hypothetical protein [Sphingomonas sp. GB1N7]|uniref:hypothetical protein n=1 Tax=Parasphingomonas caseinilytica TaxID=3096158 RepID=UPI002FC95871